MENVTPGHCTGEPTFAALKQAFGDHLSMPGWARRSRLDRVRAPRKDAVEHQRSMPTISHLPQASCSRKTHSGSLRGEGSLPKQKLTGADKVIE